MPTPTLSTFLAGQLRERRPDVFNGPVRPVGDEAEENAEGIRTEPLDVEDIRQPDDYSCVACAAMSSAHFFGKGPATVGEWKKALGTNVKDSTRPVRVVEYLRSLGLEADPRQRMTINDLWQCWQDGKPVICFIQEYGIPSKRASFDYGHAVVSIGVGLGLVLVQDPSIDNVLQGQDADQAQGRMPINYAKWMQVWHDKDVDGNVYNQFGIVVGPGNGKQGNALLQALKPR